MKIMLVGGNIAGMGGDTNVIKNIGNVLGSEHEVYYFPYLPIFQKPANISNMTVLEKRLSIDVITSNMSNCVPWWYTVLPYLEKSSIRGLAYYPITLYNKSLFEKYIRKIQPDVVHIHGIPIDAMPFIEVSLEQGVPLVVTCHGLYAFDANQRLWFKEELEKDIFVKVAESDTPLTAVSNSVAQKMVREYNIPIDAISVILNGVDLAPFNSRRGSRDALRRIYGIPADKIILLHVANLSKRKNHGAVLHALKQMGSSLRQQLLYLIIGDGAEKTLLMNFVNENGLSENVMFKGRVLDDQLYDLYALSDYFILPSTSEGLPLVYLEAIAAGLPIITFGDLDGIDDIYAPFCMELIPDREVSSLIASIESTITKDWDRTQIVNYASTWTWDAVCDGYLSLYVKSIEGKMVRD